MKVLWPLPVMALSVLLAGCAPSYYGQGVRLSRQGDPERAVDMFYQEIRQHPDNQAAWRELGVAFFDLQDYGKAAEALQQANRIRPDARATLTLGLIHERLDQFDVALAAYRAAAALEPDRRTAGLIRAHTRTLVQRRIEQDIAQALQAEAGLDPARIPANTIAVVEFDRTRLPASLAPLSKGFVEFAAADLAKVHSLQVVERQKIDTLLRELALSQTDLTDPAARLRVGRLVGSRNLVTGSLVGDADDRLEVFGAVGNTLDASIAHADVKDGSLDEFFRIQKDFVLEVVQVLGIQISPEERAAIAEVPTESFLAFLAYCRGLEAEAGGDFAGAARHYGQAAEADAGFSEAKLRKELAADAAQYEKDTSATGAGSFAEAVSVSVLDAQEQQLYLIMLAENSQFMPSESQDVPMENEKPLIPSTSSATGVPIIVRGVIDGSR